MNAINKHGTVPISNGNARYECSYSTRYETVTCYDVMWADNDTKHSATFTSQYRRAMVAESRLSQEQIDEEIHHALQQLEGRRP
jgi:hypothetical protein